MMAQLARLFSGLVLSLLGLNSVGAASPSPVRASLVSANATVQPGQPFKVALRLEHDPHWHTYWINPGTGLPTKLEWKLPAGWKAGEIQWPAPRVLRDRRGSVIGNGYEGDLLLAVELTPPAGLEPGATVELKAKAEWLMCNDTCVPGEAQLALTLPVSIDPPKSDPRWSDRFWSSVADLPRRAPAWKVTASRTANSVTLVVTPVGPSRGTPRDLHFFADDNFVAYELPQRVKSEANGGISLILPISEDGPKDAKTLRGVLTSEGGWVAGGSLRGLQVETEIGPSKAATLTPLPASSRGFVGTIFLALVGGLILNLMPCVFPVIGIKILGFVNQAGSDRKKIIGHGVAFAIGVLLSFWLLAGVLATVRSSGAQLGWGFQLQSPAFVFSLAALILVFAMNMSGVFEFGLRATSVGAGWQMKSGLSGSFFSGVLATVVATPCSAPFLAPALGAALVMPTVESFVIFTCIAVGLAMPYLLLSIFPGAVRVLPRPGAWMETFKQFVAFPLYATVGYLVWVLAGQTDDEGLQNVLFGLVLIALGVWIYGRWNAAGASASRARFGVAGVTVLALAGGWLGWPRAASARAGSTSAPDVVWETWSPEALAKLRSEGRIVYVDFTARWCATCQANKKLVFHSADVLKLFAEKKVATLRADWTNRDPRITAELASYTRSAVPFNLVWLPGQDEPAILPELLTPGIVMCVVTQ